MYTPFSSGIGGLACSSKGIMKCMVKLLSQSGPWPCLISVTTGDVIAIFIPIMNKINITVDVIQQ